MPTKLEIDTVKSTACRATVMLLSGERVQNLNIMDCAYIDMELWEKKADKLRMSDKHWEYSLIYFGLWVELIKQRNLRESQIIDIVSKAKNSATIAREWY
jgi:hypothetical protein